ncbi:MAG: calcium/sodium antiporter [Gammaproteobacteria bacterium]|nr:MAG: calcium/sodium antiporter [Gammaproteobacteria bacterium]
MGNAIGSNIANIGLVLGATALIRPLRVDSRIIRRELPLMFAAMFLVLALIRDERLSRPDGLILALAMTAVIVWLLRLSRGTPEADLLVSEIERELPVGMSTARALVWLVLGLALMLGGSHVLVRGAVGIATALGVSDLVIGLTIVAVGTSLPELAASVMSALKGEAEMAIGNIIGSNIFNSLAVLALPGLIRPATLDPAVLGRDFPIMLLFSLVLLLGARGFRGRPGRLCRSDGSLLLTGFIAYQLFLYYDAGSL